MHPEFKTGIPRDLAQETLNLLSKLREPIVQEREVLTELGFVFLTVDAKSPEQVHAENGDYFEYVDPPDLLQVYIPPQAFEVAVNPSQLRIIGSNHCSLAEQLRMVEDYSRQEIETVAAGAKAIILPATGYAQLDIQYQKENDGRVLIPNFWACALDKGVDSDVAAVGRNSPAFKLGVYAWFRWGSLARLWAVPAVVFVG